MKLNKLKITGFIVLIATIIGYVSFNIGIYNDPSNAYKMVQVWGGNFVALAFLILSALLIFRSKGNTNKQ